MADTPRNKDDATLTPQAENGGALSRLSAPTVIGAYGGRGAVANALAGNPWGTEHKHWTQTVKGKLAIRLFTRGIVGSAFFAIGQIMAGKGMQGYHPDRPVRSLAKGSRLKTFMHNIAWAVDKAVGAPIQKAVTLATGDPEKGLHAVTFRHQRQVFDGKQLSTGRSLGSEVVNITFDFAMASIGNGLGDEIAYGIFDPKTRASWLKNGHFDPLHALKRAAKGVWKILSYRQGEDWAVAIFYAYYMKAQHKLIDTYVAPGFNHDFVRGHNGGSVIVNDKGKIVGNYQLAGALDLQGRFTVYNIGTLIFRETYNKIGKALVGWKNKGFGAPEIAWPKTPGEAIHTAAESTVDTAKYLIRSAIKGTIIMTPSVPFFWMWRTPQSKYRGVAIHPEYGPVSILNPNYNPRDPSSRRALNVTASRELFQTHYGLEPHVVDSIGGPGDKAFFRSRRDITLPSKHPFADIPDPAAPGGVRHFDPFGNHHYDFAKGPKQGGLYSALNKGFNMVLNPLGRLNYKANQAIKPVAMPFASTFSKNESTQRRFSRTYTDAAFAYTPYFAIKTDVMGNLYDNAQMNMSIDRAVDGVFHLNLGEVKAGFQEVLSTLKRKPLADPKRAAKVEAARQNKPDDSSPRTAHVPGFADRSAIEGGSQQRDVTPEELAAMPAYQPGSGGNHVEKLEAERKAAEQALRDPWQPLQLHPGGFAARIQQEQLDHTVVPPGISVH